MKGLPPCPADLFDKSIKDIKRIDTSQLRAFTWVPNPDKYTSHKPTTQYKLLLTWVLLTVHKYFSYFCFTPELTNTGNIHIHGFYIIKDPIKYYKYFIPRCKSLGFVLIKNNVDDNWYEYCKKDINIMSEILSKLPYPLTNQNIDKYRKIFKDKHLKPRRIRKILKYVPQKTSILDFINKK